MSLMPSTNSRSEQACLDRSTNILWKWPIGWLLQQRLEVRAQGIHTSNLQPLSLRCAVAFTDTTWPAESVRHSRELHFSAWTGWGEQDQGSLFALTCFYFPRRLPDDSHAPLPELDSFYAWSCVDPEPWILPFLGHLINHYTNNWHFLKACHVFVQWLLTLGTWDSPGTF